MTPTPKPISIACPREKSYMTPCVARDGRLAQSDDGVCIGCEMNVADLFKELVLKYVEMLEKR